MIKGIAERVDSSASAHMPGRRPHTRVLPEHNDGAD
jgi:hypothetical protein